jgi:diaminohydroxyphosphoribosylaminopyrimidine deaminase / 5-amino-6-(5-phosphoribosylamino)uracil reductase
MLSNEELIRRTFELARQSGGANFPNPMVGAVLVKNGRIIGEGFHRQYGDHHAEIDALKNATESVAGATLYVNLEPCCHTHKQTPPCAQRLIQEKIKKVVIANLDPNPLVNGQGIKLLQAAQIEVEHGVLAPEGELLNEVFFHAQKLQRPFVHLKLATSLDGKIALPSGESQWITGAAARTHVHEQRAHSQAVMIGAGTLRADNPRLNVRLPDYQGAQPYRVIFTTSGKLPNDSQLFNDEYKERTLVYTQAPYTNAPRGIEVVKIDQLEAALRDLFARKLISLYLEGGAQLSAAFMQAGLVDRVSVYLNPSFLGAGPGAMGDLGLKQLAQRPQLTQVTGQWLGEDFCLTGRTKKGN